MNKETIKMNGSITCKFCEPGTFRFLFRQLQGKRLELQRLVKEIEKINKEFNSEMKDV